MVNDKVIFGSLTEATILEAGYWRHYDFTGQKLSFLQKIIQRGKKYIKNSNYLDLMCLNIGCSK